ncbi:hypothetical protein V8J36_15465 [Frigidibacter sp. MR17.14]|uniref:hypothetical protein n=1 Tax=Frigidibacter sp. MR17.14 TaxID=3126509 RepID=UPI00301310A3
MKRFGLVLVSLLAVAPVLAAPGLAAAAIHARVDDIKLTSKQLTVRFKDGAVCRSTMQPEGGMGMFIDCPHHARFDVRVKRQSWLAPALGDLVEPYATVVIIAEDGRAETFKTPGSMDRRFPRYD